MVTVVLRDVAGSRRPCNAAIAYRSPWAKRNLSRPVSTDPRSRAARARNLATRAISAFSVWTGSTRPAVAVANSGSSGTKAGYSAFSSSGVIVRSSVGNCVQALRASRVKGRIQRMARHFIPMFLHQRRFARKRALLLNNCSLNYPDGTYRRFTF